MTLINKNVFFEHCIKVKTVNTFYNYSILVHKNYDFMAALFKLISCAIPIKSILLIFGYQEDILEQLLRPHPSN
jgi:hypothetical protein